MTDSTRDTGQAAEPGTVSRLLVEIARASENDLAASWREPLKPGDVVGRYQIRREIGRGGFGAVYEAFDPQLGRVVALKALKPGRSKHPVSEEWIQKEAEAVAKLDHPAIVTIFDVGTCPAGAYLVMELLRGETLARRIEKGPLPVDEALRIAEQMAEGLAHAHSRGVLHRDLKPANVFVCEDGRVKLLDFGLAHLLGTGGSDSAGTPAYMAPEQAAGAVIDERADVYAAGMVLGEMVAGERPGRSTALNVAGLPRAVGKLVERARSEAPETRPSDGDSWLAELRSARLLKDRPRRTRRVALLAGLGAVVGLAVAAVATWRIWERQIPGGRPTVAVADFANETGDPEFDSIAGLLTTSLEQGTQLRVLTRGRMLDVLRQLGKEKVDRIDEALAREVGREARANALLLASIRRMGDAFVVEMRALDPLHDEYAFTVSDRAAGKAGVIELVDRLGETTRRRLGVAGNTAPERPRSVAAVATTSVKAWELLSRSRAAFDQGRGDEAMQLALDALKEDPEFALAHFQAASVATWGFHGGEGQTNPHLDAAVRLADRLPERERLATLALQAQVDLRWEDAMRLRDQAAAAYPLDKEAQFFAGDIRYHRVQVDEAIPYFRQAVRLDPNYRLASEHLTDALVEAGVAGENLAWLREQVPLARTSSDLQSIGRAFLAAGSEEEAVPLFRRSAELDGGPWPRLSLAEYLCFSGRAAEAEAATRAWLEGNPDDGTAARKDSRTEAHRALSIALRSQGRLREWDARAAMVVPGPRAAQFRRRQASAIGGDTPGFVSASEAIRGGGAWVVYQSALLAGTAGMLDVAGPLAAEFLSRPEASEPQPVVLAVVKGIATSTSATPDAARGEFEMVAALPRMMARWKGSILLGHLLRRQGDCAAAVPAYERASAATWSPAADERIVAIPVLLHSLARCHEKMGDLPKARARNDELLRLWVNADPDLPLLAEARAMQARLAQGGAGGPGTPANP